MNLLSKNDKVLLSLLLVTVITTVIIRSAWVSDDAYISFRTVDNALNGLGLTWNTFERAQGYTHPLWMLLVLAAAFLTRDVYFTSIGLTLICSLLAIWVGFRITRTPSRWIALTVLLISSRAFIDFTTSGLENALGYALSAVFILLLLKSWPDNSYRSLVVLVAVFALLLLTRLDFALLWGLALTYKLVTHPLPYSKRFTAIALGLAPFIAWEIFSLIYYGSLVPNTAYAKLAIDLPRDLLTTQGIAYLATTLAYDPITLIAITLAIGIALLSRNFLYISIATGLVLYLLYIISIGGDFMLGRFLAVPYFVASILLVNLIQTEQMQALVVIPLLVIALLGPKPPLTYSPEDGGDVIELSDNRGIADERLFYYKDSGLLRTKGSFSAPLTQRNSIEGLSLRQQKNPVIISGSIGFLGYYAGPHTKIIDYIGLTDPLMARLPLQPGAQRVGHYARAVPCGYVETLQTGQNKLCHSALAEYYTHLTKITQGPLFTKERWQTIWKLHTGHYDTLITEYKRTPL